MPAPGPPRPTIRAVAVDDTRDAFAGAAAEDGIVLESGSFDWLCEQGHVGLERVAKARRDPALVAPVIAALERLEAICARLKGDVSVLHAARENLLLPGRPRARADRHRGRGRRAAALHARSGSAALDLYPPDAALGFDLDEHAALCRALVRDGPTRSRAASPRRASASAGVQRERAYHDALRDLAAPAMGHPPLVRIAALDGDGAAAYRAPPRALLASALA